MGEAGLQLRKRSWAPLRSSGQKGAGALAVPRQAGLLSGWRTAKAGVGVPCESEPVTQGLELGSQ